MLELYFVNTSGRTEDEARQNAAKKFNVGLEKISLRQGDLINCLYSECINGHR